MLFDWINIQEIRINEADKTNRFCSGKITQKNAQIGLPLKQRMRVFHNQHHISLFERFSSGILIVLSRWGNDRYPYRVK